MNLIPNTLSLIIVGLLALVACWAFIIIIKDIYYELQELFAKLKSKKEDEAIKECRKFLDKLFCEHVSIIGDGISYTFYLYRDEYFNDEIISKIQDILSKYPNIKVKIVYD